MRDELGEKEERIYDFIADFISKNAYSPSIREIAEGCSMSNLAQVRTKLRRLRRLGMIDYKDQQPRTITLIRYSLTEKGKEVLRRTRL